MNETIRTIRLKLMIAFLLPVFGLLYFSAGQVYDKFVLFRKSRYLEQVTNYAVYAAKLTRELQKERGLSLGFHSGNTPGFFRKELKQQREKTDDAYRKLHRLLWTQDDWQGERLIKNFLTLYGELGALRTEVDKRQSESSKIFHGYSRLIQTLIETTETLRSHFINENFARTITAFEELLRLTEISGKERALIASLLETRERSPALLNRISLLDKEYRDLLRNFKQHASVHVLQLYQQSVGASLEKSFDTLRQRIIDGKISTIDSRNWWELSTDFINSIYRVNFDLLHYLDRLKERQKTDAIRTLSISVILWLLFVSFLYALMIYILKIIERFGQTLKHKEDETRLYKTFTEFSEYLVFHRNEEILRNSLTGLLYQSKQFRYLWLAEVRGEEIVPLHSENISLAGIEEELGRRRSANDPLRHAIHQALSEKYPHHFEPKERQTFFYEQTGELGVFPVVRHKRCVYLVVAALPSGTVFTTLVIDLIQNMCNSLGAVLEAIDAERKEKELMDRLRVAATAFNAHEAITITDANGTIVQVNDAFTKITGYRQEEAVGNNPNILKSGRHDHHFYASMWDNIRKEGYWKGEIYNRRKNGEIYPEMLSISAVRNERGEIINYVAHFFDITEIKDAQQDAEYRAQHDPLTDLYNRQKLTEELERIYMQAQKTKEYNAFIYLDLDNFKQINDYYNHEMGDKVLIEIARRLRGLVHSDDLLARIAGDEFALILCCLGTDRMTAIKKITIVVEKLKNLFQEAVEIDGTHFELSFSIGIKLFPDSEREWSEVMINADVAMYHAKKNGKNQYNFYDDNLDLKSKQFLQLKNDFSRALKERELVVYYQPRIRVSDGKLTGMEALIRWTHPEKGLIYPDDFLFVSQGNSLGFELNNYVLDTVCHQLKVWQKRFPDFALTVSVNISGDQFNSRSYIENTLKFLRNHSDVTQRLEFEIVEDALLNDLEHTVKVIRELKSLGIGFCMDDFGTGYSSIEYLKRLPVDIVKIDRGFILDLFHDRNDEVVKLIVKTAEIFGLRTVAEGVENVRTLDFLRSIDCTYYQGFLYAPPVTAGEMEKIIAEHLRES